MIKTLLDARALTLAERLAPTDLTLAAGTLTAVIGPNGSGKTSLLRALARVERPGGQVLLDGRDLDRQPPAWRLANLALLPAGRDMAWPIPVRDLLSLGTEAAGPGLAAAVAALELAPLLDRPTDRLSTGERSRVLIARLLAGTPRLLLLDEPLSHLDPYWVTAVMRLLRDAASDGAAVLLSLHDLHQLGRCDRVLLMAGGRIVGDATPAEVLADPAFEQVFRVPAADVAAVPPPA